MTAPEIVVHEKRPRWTPELQRQFMGEAVRVRACWSLADIAPRPADDGPLVAVLDLDAAPAESLHFLARGTGRPWRLPVLVLASPRMADLEWSVRELGATAFLPADIGGDELATLCRRQWRIFD